MSDSTVRDLFRSLEQTLHERLRTIEDVLRLRGGSATGEAASPQFREFVSRLERVERLLGHMEEFSRRLHFVEEALESHGAPPATPILPLRPMEGIEVVPRREVSIPLAQPPEGTIRDEDRLIMNRAALKALEEEEAAEAGEDSEMEEEVAESAVESEPSEDVEENHVEVHVKKEPAVEKMDVEEPEVEEEAEEEAEEAEEEDEEEAEELELEEFEYKGATYYRDGENNVYMTDEDGELVQDPIGVWNEAKQKILVSKKPVA